MAYVILSEFASVAVRSINSVPKISKMYHYKEMAAQKSF